ncbi:16S rRNA (guanine(966)-N(2))-methyltransferase RsmD [Candidatus Saccharibacteria bacterium RIFCSPHIGHO2_12_FULL_48_21]|nr:MAG: 16S rRNA (guanine(966)-N(2))-methyltransferase RsmD [Candidatus Saccharibacteria bacterium RIFCSPHIGHO2_12_FULL_48_21]
MRVIAGELGGRQIHEPRGHKTHPMSEKLRGALFNALGDIVGLSVLDAFAGSGALAIEAISRGAKKAIAIDVDRPAYSVLERNIKELELDQQIKCTRANTGGWSDKNQQVKFDLVLLDPPYDDPQLGLIQKICRRHAAGSGLVILSWPGDTVAPKFDGLELIKQKQYGDAQLVFYRKSE